MPKIHNLEGLTVDLINREIDEGAKFIVFEYCISLVVITFKVNTDIHYIRPNENTFKYSFAASLVSLLLGWWGIPWGPIRTISTLSTNFSGGKDVTFDVFDQFNLEHYIYKL